MDAYPIAVVGDGNIAGNNLVNVGNRRVFNFYASQRENGKILAVLKPLVAFDALLNAKERYPAPRCHPDTRKAAQDVVTNWLCRKGDWADRPIMWMSGAPGVGKSAILQTGCETLGTDDGSHSWLSKFGFGDTRYVDGSFFFGRGLGNREKAAFFPVTIAYQLARSRSSCNSSLKKIVAKNPSLFEEALPVQFRKLVLKPVKDRWSFLSPVTIVIDALDECDNADDRVEILNLILEAVKESNMRVLIASRPEQEIHAFFQRKDVLQHTYHIRLDEESFQTSRDIETFLRSEFARIRQSRPEVCLPLPNGEDWPGIIVILQIRDDSDSQFIFPRLAIDYIDTPSFSPNQQLHNLLTAPPPHAFSKLDALYHLIITRRSADLILAGDGALRHYQEVVMSILQIIVAWPGGPLSASQIARILRKQVDIVQNIIRGPMRSLFKFKSNDPDSPIALCHKSLRDYLLDRTRSYEFFIPAGDADVLFYQLLSHQPSSSDSIPSYSQDDCLDVLTALTVREQALTEHQIGGLLDIDTDRVECIVNGPAKWLFNVDAHGAIQFSTPAVRNFLLDPKRSEGFYINDKDPDAFFLRILSRHPPSDPLGSPSEDARSSKPILPRAMTRDVLLDVLTILVFWPEGLTVAQVAATLDLDHHLVEDVIWGPAKSLFKMNANKVLFSSPSLKPFLQDASRSGNFFINGTNPDPVFKQILARQPPPDSPESYSRDTLLDVLTALVFQNRPLSMDNISTLLDLDPSLVERVIVGPAKALFDIDDDHDIQLSTPALKPFLWNADRSGDFFIHTKEPDAFFLRILARHSHFTTVDFPQEGDIGAPSAKKDNCGLRSILTAVLCLFFVWSEGLTVDRIAAALNTDLSVVHNTAFGSAKSLFRMNANKVLFSSPSLKPFLQDPSRSGHFSINGTDPDPIFRQILSRQPPSDSRESYSRDALLDVLTALAVQDIPLSVHDISTLVDLDSSLVERIIDGPAKTLFDVNDDGVIQLSTPALKPFLQDADRSGKFFIHDKEPDAFFLRILARHSSLPTLDFSIASSSTNRTRNTLLAVLTLFFFWTEGLTVDQIAAALNTNLSVVHVIVFGPTKSLFRTNANRVLLSSPSLKSFLQDRSRSEDFFIKGTDPDPFFKQILSLSVPSITTFLRDGKRAGDHFIPSDKPDPFFTQLLSRQPPSDVPQSYSHDILMGVLSVVVALPSRLTMPKIASFLDIAPSLVEGVVLGPMNILFEVSVYNKTVGFTLHAFRVFLLDPGRAGEFFVSNDRPDPLFAQILSRPAPSHLLQPYSKDVLMGVLRVVVALPRCLSVPQMASVLDVAPNLVEGVMLGPAAPLFRLFHSTQVVSFSAWAPFKYFLLDAKRAGEYFVPSNKPDPLFIQILSRQPPCDTLQSYSRDEFMGVLRVVVALPGLKVPTIASILNLAPSLVEGVVLGPTSSLFNLDSSNKVSLSTSYFKEFLLSSSRAGEFFIRSNNPDHFIISILSRQPLSTTSTFDPAQHRDILMRVLTLLALPSSLSTSQIASVLDLDPALVSGVVGPEGALPFVAGDGNIWLPGPFKDFVHDANRAQEFYIPRMDLNPNYSSLSEKVWKIYGRC